MAARVHGTGDPLHVLRRTDHSILGDRVVVGAVEVMLPVVNICRPGLFAAQTRGDAAVLRGKVWPRDEPEPATWTIEAVHERGNLQGSPGFFGNSKVSEIYVDNVLVEELP